MKLSIFNKESGTVLVTALLMMAILLLLGSAFLTGVIYEEGTPFFRLPQRRDRHAQDFP